jgi:hypothetical protein
MPDDDELAAVRGERDRLKAQNTRLRHRQDQMLRELARLREMEQRAELRAESDDPAERASALWILGSDRPDPGRHRAGEGKKR